MWLYLSIVQVSQTKLCFSWCALNPWSHGAHWQIDLQSLVWQAQQILTQSIVALQRAVWNPTSILGMKRGHQSCIGWCSDNAHSLRKRIDESGIQLIINDLSCTLEVCRAERLIEAIALQSSWISLLRSMPCSNQGSQIQCGSAAETSAALCYPIWYMTNTFGAEFIDVAPGQVLKTLLHVCQIPSQNSRVPSAALMLNAQISSVGKLTCAPKKTTKKRRIGSHVPLSLHALEGRLGTDLNHGKHRDDIYKLWYNSGRTYLRSGRRGSLLLVPHSTTIGCHQRCCALWASGEGHESRQEECACTPCWIQTCSPAKMPYTWHHLCTLSVQMVSLCIADVSCIYKSS